MQVLFGAFQKTTISKNTHSRVSRTLKISVQLNKIKMIKRCDLTIDSCIRTISTKTFKYIHPVQQL